MNKEKWIQCALGMGLDEFEIYQDESFEKGISWFDGKMDGFETSHITGTSIRGTIDGKMGSMALEQVCDDQCERVISQLMDSIEYICPKEKDHLRKPEPIEWIHKDINWVQPSMDLVYDTIQYLEKQAYKMDERVIQVSHISWNESKSTRSIFNSHDMNVTDHNQLQYLAMSVVVKEKDEVKTHNEIEIVEDFNLFNRDEFLSKLIHKSILKLNSTSYPSQKMKVIFEKNAMTSLFSSFMGLFSGDLIYKGISCLKGKENQKIFSDLITIVDDPKNLESLTICCFDDEGCPTRKKKLVEKGIYRVALQSTKSASRLHTESTGNGFKSGYASPVSVQPMNCCIKPGHLSLDSMIQEMKDGIVIEELAGLHSGIDFVSTNFSLQASGYLVVNGKRDRSISLITVAGNFMDLMNQVICVGNDLDWSYRTVASPSIYFKECSISGE